MPSKKRKFNSRFPTARIKRIMQSDEDVGKVAATVPVVISRVLEIFIEKLLMKASSVTKARNAKVLTPSHVKQAVLSEKQFDFLKDIMAAIADVQQDNDESEAAPRPKGRPRKKPEENDGKAGKVVKPKRAAKAQASSDDSEDSANDDDEEDEDEDDEAPRHRRQAGSSSRAAPPATAVRSNLALLADASASAQSTDSRAGTSAASALASIPAGVMPPLVPIGTLPQYSDPYVAPHLYPGMSMMPPFIDPRLLPADMRAHMPRPWAYGGWQPSVLWPPPLTDSLPANSHMLSVSRSDEGEEADSGVVDLSLVTPNRSRRRHEQTDDNDYDAA